MSTAAALAAALRRSPPPPPAHAPHVAVTSLLMAGIDPRPVDVGGALVALDTVATRLYAVGDARAVFPDVYGIVTRRVAEVIDAGTLFVEPGWIARLAGRFAERYFDALVPSLTGAAVPSDAWRVAFAAGRAGPRVPVRDALLGINAHINFDLAQGLADNIREAGHAHDPRMLARYRHDHDAVNDILRAATPEVCALLLARHRCPVTWVATRSRRVHRALTAYALDAIAGWRSQVWADMLDLLHATDARARLAAMNRRSGRLARTLAASNPAWVYRAGATTAPAAGATSIGEGAAWAASTRGASAWAFSG
ncbi:MAG: DUF5995 family protein [Pseudomonadota bacterium]|nr:DUF5995 family protein [Pseudomonadota bacterium]